MIIDNMPPVIESCSFYGKLEACKHAKTTSPYGLCGIFNCPRLHKSVKEVLRKEVKREHESKKN